MAITYRTNKGSALTHAELDQNFAELQTTIDNVSGLTDYVNGTILERVNAIESATVPDLTSITTRLDNQSNRLTALENPGYVLLDVFNNVYKNIPNHTDDLSHGRIRSLELFRATAIYGGISDAKWDQWMDYVRYNNENAILTDLNSMGPLQQMQMVAPVIALINYRVYAFNKIYGRSYSPMTLDTFNSWNPGTQWNTDIATFNNSLNNLTASDDVIYAYLKNQSMTPFTSNTLVTGWSPV